MGDELSATESGPTHARNTVFRGNTQPPDQLADVEPIVDKAVALTLKGYSKAASTRRRWHPIRTLQR